jgi:hypothetical protein
LNGRGPAAGYEIYTRRTAIASDYGRAWWERARLELTDGDVPAARNSLTAMLEVTREPELRTQVATMQRRARQMRERRLQRVEAVIERQQCVASERHNHCLPASVRVVE